MKLEKRKKLLDWRENKVSERKKLQQADRVWKWLTSEGNPLDCFFFLASSPRAQHYFGVTEKREAAARRAEKNAKKRAHVQEKAAEARKAAQLKLLALQEDRSKVFDQLTACAKVHDDAEYYTACEAVKQAIADKQIAAHGWERLPTVEADHVRTDGRDLQKTTLLHLAVQASDPELVDWLVRHGKFILFSFLLSDFQADPKAGRCTSRRTRLYKLHASPPSSGKRRQEDARLLFRDFSSQ